jgi:hypothetical protein
MANIIQISDPHFGDDICNTREWPWLLDSLNAHDFNLCLALDKFLSIDMIKQDPPAATEEPLLLMNGDLTAYGKSSQFGVGNTFLFSQHSVVSDDSDKQPLVGLAHPLKSENGSDLYADIPGNHDHGGGKWLYPIVKGFDPRIYAYFHNVPPYVNRYYSSDGIEICVFGIDSCTTFAEATLNLNPEADGGFSAAHRKAFIELLMQELSKPLTKGFPLRTAVILCHHPFRTDGQAGPLSPENGYWLAKVASMFGIRMILTGHTHSSWTEPVEFKDINGITQQVREVRCPTTLQVPARLDPETKSPGLWWHTVAAKGDSVVWQGTLLLYSGDRFQLLIDDKQATVPQRVEWYSEEVPNLEPPSDELIDILSAD